MLARRVDEETWVSISTELALPMGIGVDEGNTITHMVEGGNAHADGMLQVDDHVISVDGVDVRDGLCQLPQARDP